MAILPMADHCWHWNDQ